MSLQDLTISLDKMSQEFGIFREYYGKVLEIATFNTKFAGVYLQAFIVGYSFASNLYSQAIRCEIDAKTLLDQSEAISFLDKADDYFTSTGKKSTDTAKKQFVEMDAEVIAAKNLAARAASYVKFLQGKMQTYSSCEHAIKKLAWGQESTNQ